MKAARGTQLCTATGGARAGCVLREDGRRGEKEGSYLLFLQSETLSTGSYAARDQLGLLGGRKGGGGCFEGCRAGAAP